MGRIDDILAATDMDTETCHRCGATAVDEWTGVLRGTSVAACSERCHRRLVAPIWRRKGRLLDSYKLDPWDE